MISPVTDKMSWWSRISTLHLSTTSPRGIYIYLFCFLWATLQNPISMGPKAWGLGSLDYPVGTWPWLHLQGKAWVVFKKAEQAISKGLSPQSDLLWSLKLKPATPTSPLPRLLQVEKGWEQVSLGKKLEGFWSDADENADPQTTPREYLQSECLRSRNQPTDT